MEDVDNFENLDEVNKDYELNTDGDSNRKIYNPKVPAELIPKKGQQFDTVEDAAAFYNAYARAVGFSIRSYSSKKERESGEIRRKEFCCFKEGNSRKIVEVGCKRRRGSIGENCKARLAILRANTEKYIVTVFNEGHSHPLSSPTKTHLLRSHRNVSATAKSLTNVMAMVNIPTSKQFNVLEVQSGGVENVGFTKRDLYNHKRDMRADLKGRDGEMFYDYMKLEQGKNPSFTFKIESDDEKKITRCFWSDATSRQAYKFYGDVVIFDTTYNTNRYGLIFAPILGVNNHGQTIVFACGFLNHETVEDFIWLFNQFLEVMPSGAPKMIITDQDPAMTKAFSFVLPNTFHRYCSWHILMKFVERIDSQKYKIYKDEFSACIWKSETREEFDVQWEALIEKSGLEGHKWLKDMYDIRSRWVPAYVNHIFSANMSSSQRAESSHAFFKRFVSKNNSLLEFMIQFGRGLEHQRREELMSDHKDKIEKPKFRINHAFLVQMVEIYTNEMFQKFQDEMCESIDYRYQYLRDDDSQRVYQVQRRNVDTSKIREIVYDKILEFASCTCKKFDSAGIPCRHVIGYLVKFDDLSELPDKYILKRWTKTAKLGIVEDKNGQQIVDDGSYLLMRSQFVQSYMGLIDKALVCEETRKMFTEGLCSLSDKIDQFVSSRKSDSEKSNPICIASSTHASCTFESTYKEPDLVRAKGCGKRLKGGKEKAMAKAKNKKVRRCHGCNKVNQTHDKRNCPALLNISSNCKNNANMEEGNSTSSEDGEDIHTQ